MLAKHIIVHINKLFDASKDELGTDSKIRMQKFSKILSIYYPWVKKSEKLEMILSIQDKEIKYTNELWKKKITKLYKQDIITLFGYIDIDNSNSINIDEFILAFISSSEYTDTDLRELFKEADQDNNGILDILEFINLISKNPELRNHLETVITNAIKFQTSKKFKKLSILFKDMPNSPIKKNWRPSLANIKSPNSIKQELRLYQ